MLFGGTFDPIHDGHITLAKETLKSNQHDEVWFLLAALNPFKDENTPFEHREAMLNLMLSSYENMKVCTIENTLPKPSYSIDTIKALKSIYPDYIFSWLIGSDQIPTLNKWKSYDQLREMVTFYVYYRPGFDAPHNFNIIEGKSEAVSSTDIRTGKSLKTDDAVLSYMMQEGLYLKQMVSNQMDEKRYKHTCSVTSLALEIAEVYQFDLKRVRLMSMMHDYCKVWPKEELESILTKYNPNALKRPYAFYHAYAAAYVLQYDYKVNDIEVIEAIKHHVDGQSQSELGMLLYIADKCERTRPYDSEPFIDLAKNNLKLAYQKVKEHNYNYIKEYL